MITPRRLSEASDRRESASRGPFWLVNQRYRKLILPIPPKLIYRSISICYFFGEGEFATIWSRAATQTQNTMRDTRMQTYRPPSRAEDSQTLISIRGRRQRIERRSGSPMRGMDIAQRERSGCLPNQCPLVRPLQKHSPHHVLNSGTSPRQRIRFTRARSTSSVARPSRTAFIMNIPK